MNVTLYALSVWRMLHVCHASGTVGVTWCEISFGNLLIRGTEDRRALGTSNKEEDDQTTPDEFKVMLNDGTMCSGPGLCMGFVTILKALTLLIRVGTI
jgi:hypothetical protein